MFLNLWNKTYEDKNFKNNCYKFYHDKTIDRITLGLNNNLMNEYSIINGEEIGDVFKLLEKINFNELCLDKPTLFHGDFILDNILLNENNEYCLIDWRQDFQGNLKSYCLHIQYQ